MEKKVSLLNIFLTFAKVGAFTIGGGYAMIPIIQSELTKKAWMDESELPDIIALSQSAPGVMAVNMSIFTGYKLRGIKGSIAATLGSITPSFIAILLIAMLFSNFKDNEIVIRVFKGIRPAVVALILVPMIDMAKKNNRKWWAWVISGSALLGVAFLNFSPVYILLVTIVLALAITLFKERKRKEGAGL